MNHLTEELLFEFVRKRLKGMALLSVGVSPASKGIDIIIRLVPAGGEDAALGED